MPPITTDRGPSSKNQTSDDHSRDPNQKARQPSVKQEVFAEGLDIPIDAVRNE